MLGDKSILNKLKPVKGASRKAKILGRGAGSGRGGTSTKGHKGQNARAGTGKRVASRFEGGQMPIQRRLPKRGFTNRFRETYKIINVFELEKIGEEINPEVVSKAGLNKRKLKLKILGAGEISKPVTVHASRFSESAKKKIVEAGGNVVVIN